MRAALRLDDLCLKRLDLMSALALRPYYRIIDTLAATELARIGGADYRAPFPYQHGTTKKLPIHMPAETHAMIVQLTALWGAITTDVLAGGRPRPLSLNMSDTARLLIVHGDLPRDAGLALPNRTTFARLDRTSRRGRSSTLRAAGHWGVTPATDEGGNIRTNQRIISHLNLEASARLADIARLTGRGKAEVLRILLLQATIHGEPGTPIVKVVATPTAPH